MAGTGSSVTWREWISWLGIIVALIGFFLWQPIWLGVIGAILGIIAVIGRNRAWAWIAVIVGIIVLILGLLGWTVV